MSRYRTASPHSSRITARARWDMPAYRRRPDCCFAASRLLDDVRVEGLIAKQRASIGAGLAAARGRLVRRLSTDQQLNRLGRVVIAIEQGKWDSYVYATLHTIVMAVKHLLGGSQPLTRFEPGIFGISCGAGSLHGHSAGGFRTGHPSSVSGSHVSHGSRCTSARS